MATLVLTAVGTAIGGPIGGAIGSLIGGQIDQAIFKPKGREGPRLKELAVTTSSYGTPIPRHFGTMRAAGSIIWATDLVESSEKVGGGKGRPSTKVYSYSSSFAVALSSRPVESVARIWADGKLLRGAAGDLKVGGEFRFYSGYGNQEADPLIASAEGPDCPAFRGVAYCVFESLQLADFGNRIPALTFEIVAEAGSVELMNVVETLDFPIDIDKNLSGLAGFSDEGGEIVGSLSQLERVYPFNCDASGHILSLAEESETEIVPLSLPEPVVDPSSESFGGAAGQSGVRRTGQRQIPVGLRYYDLDRDFQAGLQRAGGKARSGRQEIFEFPGALTATNARALADAIARREEQATDSIFWRVAEIDSRISPGSLVLIPERHGLWRVASWEWRESGIELELVRRTTTFSNAAATDPGRNLEAVDLVATPTILAASELPWDGAGSSSERLVVVAASSSSSGWTGAVLYADRNGALAPVRGIGPERAILGTTITILPPAQSSIVDRSSQLEVELASSDFTLQSRPIEDLAEGQNRALVGSEIIQFGNATSLGSGRWMLSGLLRGRGGTESEAQEGAGVGADFVLLEDQLHRLTADEVGAADRVAAIGVADNEPVIAGIADYGRTVRPLTPVHPRWKLEGDGSLTLCWTRRARGAWSWVGNVDVPIVEQAELYQIGVGELDAPVISWQSSEPKLTLTGQTFSDLQATHAGETIWVRQIGSHDISQALFILTIPEV